MSPVACCGRRVPPRTLRRRGTSPRAVARAAGLAVPRAFDSRAPCRLPRGRRASGVRDPRLPHRAPRMWSSPFLPARPATGTRRGTASSPRRSTPDKAKSKSAEEAFKVVTEAFRAVMAGGASGDPNRATAHPTARNASGGDARRPFWQVHRDEAAAPPPKWSCRASTTAGRAPEPASTSAPRWTDGSSGGWGDDPGPRRASSRWSSGRREARAALRRGRGRGRGGGGGGSLRRGRLRRRPTR